MTQTEILLAAPLLPSAVAALDASFKVHRSWEQADEAAFLREVGPRIRAVATDSTRGRIDAALIDRLPNLEIISTFGVGYDNVDVQTAAARGVVVTNTPGVLDEEVADLALGLLLATLRRIPQADAYVRGGRWPSGAFPLSPTLRGRRVGIIGLGHIGKAIARRLEGFGVAIAYHGRTRQEGVAYAYHATLVALAEATDTLIAIVPGGGGTQHMIDGAVLKALGADGVLINVARGSVVDQPALIAALQDGVILGAGLDVYADEPRVPQALIDLPNVVLLPHVGSASAHTRDAMGRLMTDNIKAWFKDRKPLTPVPETAHLAGAA